MVIIRMVIMNDMLRIAGQSKLSNNPRWINNKPPFTLLSEHYLLLLLILRTPCNCWRLLTPCCEPSNDCIHLTTPHRPDVLREVILSSLTQSHNIVLVGSDCSTNELKTTPLPNMRSLW